MTRTQLGNAFGPGREVDVCDVCGVVVLVPRDGEPDWPGTHVHGANSAGTAGHFCGQIQPHAAHVWQTPPVYGSTAVISFYQCAGLPADP